MKHVLRAALTGLVCIATAADAQTSTTVPLRPGEVLLRLQATGTDSRAAERISMACTAVGTGDNRDAAKKELKDKTAKTLAALKAKGVPDGAIKALPSWKGQLGVFASAMAAAGSEDEGEASEQQEYAIDLKSVDQIAPVTEALAEAGCIRGAAPTLKLSDPAAATKRATDAAFVEARKAAEAYALRLDLKVVRIVRVDEGGGALSDLMGPQFQQMMALTASRLGGGGNDDPAQVSTTKSVTVEYVLGPK
jgi:uncharacterized protein YggE